MKLSVSNIIWEKGKEHFESFLKILKDEKVQGVELALSCIFDEPAEINKEEIVWLKGLLQEYNINVSGLHSLTYTRDDLELFNSKTKNEELIEYLEKYIELAIELKAKNIVFGSPKARKKNNKTIEKCDLIFIDFLKKIDCKLNNINFNIEPLYYEYCEYLNTYMEACSILKRAKTKNCYIQLDIRSVIESEEDTIEIFQNFNYFKHIHLGNPKFTRIGNKHQDIHKKISLFLKEINYQDFISLEMLYDEKSSKNRKDFLVEAIKEAREMYE